MHVAISEASLEGVPLHTRWPQGKKHPEIAGNQSTGSTNPHQGPPPSSLLSITMIRQQQQLLTFVSGLTVNTANKSKPLCSFDLEDKPVICTWCIQKTKAQGD